MAANSCARAVATGYQGRESPARPKTTVPKRRRRRRGKRGEGAGDGDGARSPRLPATGKEDQSRPGEGASPVCRRAAHLDMNPSASPITVPKAGVSRASCTVVWFRAPVPIVPASHCACSRVPVVRLVRRCVCPTRTARAVHVVRADVTLGLHQRAVWCRLLIEAHPPRVVVPVSNGPQVLVPWSTRVAGCRLEAAIAVHHHGTTPATAHRFAFCTGRVRARVSSSALLSFPPAHSERCAGRRPTPAQRVSSSAVHHGARVAQRYGDVDVADVCVWDLRTVCTVQLCARG